MGRRGPAPLCPSHAPRRRVGPWRRVGQTLSMQDTYAQGRGEVAPWPRRRVPWGSEPGAGGGQRMAWGRAGAPRASGRPGPGKREEEARRGGASSPPHLAQPPSLTRAGRASCGQGDGRMPLARSLEGPALAVFGPFPSAVLWPRPGREVEKHRAGGCARGISGFAGHRKHSGLRENMPAALSGPRPSPP